MKRIVVIGGGITGLSTAYFLETQAKALGIEIECVLIESSERLGGKIVTERVGGASAAGGASTAGDFIIEGGPDSFLSKKPWGMELCRQLGLLDRLIQTHPINKEIYVLLNGELQKFPAGMNLMVPGEMTPFLRTPLISAFGKLRMGLDLLIPRKSNCDDESIGSFVRRRLGEEAVSTFADPIMATIYAGDVERLSLKATFPQFAGVEQKFGSLIWGGWMGRWDAHLAKKNQDAKNAATPSYTLFVSLQDGLSSLITALREKMKSSDIRTGQKVLSVSPCGTSAAEGKGYRVISDRETILADAVIITTDAKTAAGFVKGWHERLSELLLTIQYVSTATVSLGFRRQDVKHPLNGFGYVIPRSERKNILATTCSSTKFAGRSHADSVLIRSFVGGAHQEEMVDLPDDELIRRVLEELRPVLGISGEPTVSSVFKWHKANPQYHVGHLSKIEAIEKEAEKYPGLFLAGAAYKGIGIPDCIGQGWEIAQKVLHAH
ncbi:MAG: protoporphyrinogen oxidase [Nitrospirota bacterium]